MGFSPTVYRPPARSSASDQSCAFILDWSKSGGSPLNVWIGLRASDYQMFHGFMPISYVVSVDDDPPTDLPYSSVEAAAQRRTCWSNDELETVVGTPGFQGMLNSLSDETRPVNIFCYHSLPALDLFAASHPQIRIMAPSFDLKRRLDDKFHFSSLLRTAGLPSVPSRVMSLSVCNYNALSSSFGPRIVARLRTGASGSGTFLICSAQDLELLHFRYGDQLVALSPYLSGLSFNVNGFVGRSVHLAPPSVQLIGLEQLGTTPFTYCGNDYALMSHLPQALLQDIHNSSCAIGNALREFNYYGIFGVDILYDQKLKIAYPIEVNPRFQGSTPTLTRYHLSCGYDTLVHLFKAEIDVRYQYEPVQASLMLLHNTHRDAFTVRAHIPSGVYSYNWCNDQLQLRLLSTSALFPLDGRQILIVGCPQRGTTVDPGAALLRIEVFGSILNPTTLRLDAVYEQLVRALETLILTEGSICVA